MSGRWRGDKHKLILEAPCARITNWREWESHTGSLIIIEGLKGFNDKNNWKRKCSKQNKIRGRMAKPLLMEQLRVLRDVVETLEVVVARQRRATNEMHSEICIDKQQQMGQLGRQWFLVGGAPHTIPWFSDFQFSTLLEVHSICQRKAGGKQSKAGEVT